MRTLVIVLGLIVHGFVCAAEPVCVRNFNAGGVNPCETHSHLFQYTVPADPEMKFALCVKLRPGKCDGEFAEYRWVVTEQGGKICVLNYNQKVTGNFCESEKLKTYHYAVTPG